MTTRSNTAEAAELANLFNAFYREITSGDISRVGMYQILGELGEGSFGKVYLARHVILGVEVVLKCGVLDDPNIVREVYYHRMLRHRNIVVLHEVIRTELHLWLVLEYCAGGDLFNYIYLHRRVDPRNVSRWFLQIVIAVQHVHAQNLAHRDLKLENILLHTTRSRTCVKVTDFGFVREYNPSVRRFLRTVCGTTAYMAPELIRGDPYLGFSIDIWLLGVILYTMLYGVMPFDHDDDAVQRAAIVHDSPRLLPQVPSSINDLITRLLSKDPRQRPSLEAVLALPLLSRRYQRHLSRNRDFAVSEQPQKSLRAVRSLEKKLRALGIDVQMIASARRNNGIDSLSAFYGLALVKEQRETRNHRPRTFRNILARPPLEMMLSSLSIRSMVRGLTLDLQQMSARPSMEKRGATPDVSLTPNHRIHRLVLFSTGERSSDRSSASNLSHRRPRLLSKLQFWRKPSPTNSPLSLRQSSLARAPTQMLMLLSDLSQPGITMTVEPLHSSDLVPAPAVMPPADIRPASIPSLASQMLTAHSELDTDAVDFVDDTLDEYDDDLESSGYGLSLRLRRSYSSASAQSRRPGTRRQLLDVLVASVPRIAVKRLASSDDTVGERPPTPSTGRTQSIRGSMLSASRFATQPYPHGINTAPATKAKLIATVNPNGKSFNDNPPSDSVTASSKVLPTGLKMKSAAVHPAKSRSNPFRFGGEKSASRSLGGIGNMRSLKGTQLGACITETPSSEDESKENHEGNDYFFGNSRSTEITTLRLTSPPLTTPPLSRRVLHGLLPEPKSRNSFPPPAPPPPPILSPMPKTGKVPRAAAIVEEEEPCD